MRLEVSITKRVDVDLDAAKVISSAFLEWLDHSGHIQNILSPAGPSYVELANMFVNSIESADTHPIGIIVVD